MHGQQQGTLTPIQLDQLLSLLAYSHSNKDRPDSFCTVGLELVTLEALCQRFASTFPLKADAFKVMHESSYQLLVNSTAFKV